MEKEKRTDRVAGPNEPGVAEVVRLATEARDPHPSWWSQRRSAQKAAADLLPELIDERIVDAVLHLPEGTTRTWLDEDNEFRGRVVSRRLELENAADPEIDYMRSLTPKQIRAGLLLVGEETTQRKVAELLGVDPRTIRNWHKRPVFRRYLEQLKEQRARELRLEAEAEKRAIRDKQRALHEKAGRVLADRLDAGDVKAAVAVYRLLIDR
jgi:putative insertion element HTH domain-containing protein